MSVVKVPREVNKESSRAINSVCGEGSVGGKQGIIHGKSQSRVLVFEVVVAVMSVRNLPGQ